MNHTFLTFLVFGTFGALHPKILPEWFVIITYMLALGFGIIEAVKFLNRRK